MDSCQKLSALGNSNGITRIFGGRMFKTMHTKLYIHKSFECEKNNLVYLHL